MASSSLNILSGIAAAAAGFAGEKVPKNGSIPGLDLAAIVPALLGKTGGASGIAGALASVAAKSGLLDNSKLGNLADLAGSLFSSGNTGAIKKTTGGIEGLAAAILGNSGSGAALGSIASMAITLAKSVKNKKELTDIASNLGKTLSGTFGVSFNGAGTALKALNNVLGSDAKGELFKVILKNLA
ncbi:MAG: hypothetical protein LBB72_02290 [Spirochaetaceae bacterium]|jgi:hypothetical protein|nr:hypothetical protein [Spirochaetaceae bacterium]